MPHRHAGNNIRLNRGYTVPKRSIKSTVLELANECFREAGYRVYDHCSVCKDIGPGIVFTASVRTFLSGGCTTGSGVQIGSQIGVAHLEMEKIQEEVCPWISGDVYHPNWTILLSFKNSAVEKSDTRGEMKATLSALISQIDSEAYLQLLPYSNIRC